MQRGFVGILALILIVVATLGGVYYYKFETGKMCGGIAGNIPERQCAPGFRCNNPPYPDASGQCTVILPFASKSNTPIPIMTQGVSDIEKQKIDAWIVENNLNQYGDSKDTVYTGGTPLFDERTGKSTDRYEYIIQKHPDKPWNK